MLILHLLHTFLSPIWALRTLEFGTLIAKIKREFVYESNLFHRFSIF